MKSAATLATFVVFAACGTAPEPTPWITVFGADAIAPYVSSEFGGDGAIAVKNDRLVLGIGSPLTGITWTESRPRGNYELEVTVARLSGNDFFCGLTFPVETPDGTSYLTLVLGGWGGAVCGLSSLDGQDAARNMSRTLHHFENGRDYTALVRVVGSRIEVTLDGAPFFAIDHEGQRLSLRPEVELSRPFGIASFSTEAAVRSVRWRPF